MEACENKKLVLLESIFSIATVQESCSTSFVLLLLLLSILSRKTYMTVLARARLMRECLVSQNSIEEKSTDITQ